MTEPTAASQHEQHTTTIEITGNGQINPAFENTEGPEGDPSPQTPPPPPNHIQRPMTPPPQVPRPNTPPPQIPTTPQHETPPHMNGETPHMNGDTKTNGVEVKTPGSEDNKEVNEAVNLELVNMQPYSNSIPIKKESTELDIGDPYDEYFVPVNQHKKYMRGEKLYVTQDKRRSLGGSKKKCCWGVLTVIVLGGIVAILIGVILSSQDSVSVEESRNFNGIKASIGGGIIPTPSPSSTPAPTRPTTDMSEIYLNNVLQGELTIDNLEFTPGLADKNSSEFRNLAASLEEELKSALFDHQTLHYGSADITVKVLEFRSGSVIVVYRVGWEFKDGIKNPPDPIDKDGLKTKLQEHLRSHDGFLYNYRLTLHNLKSERVTNTCKIENGGCSQNCLFDGSTLLITCTCDDPYVLDIDGKTCVNPEKNESSSQSEEASINSPEQKQGMENEHEGEHEHGEEHGHEKEHEHGMEHKHGMDHEHEHGVEQGYGGDHEHGMEHEHGMDHEHEHGEEEEHEVHQPDEHHNNDKNEKDEIKLPIATEHSSEHDYHVVTELPEEHANFGVKGTSIETYVTPIPEEAQDVTGQTSEPLSEQNTQHMYENTNYQLTEDSQYKKTSEPVRLHESIVAVTDSAETDSRNSNKFIVEQTTEAIQEIKSTEPKLLSESPNYQGPINFSEPSMESVYSTPVHPYEEMSPDTTPETTPMPFFNFNPEENSDSQFHSMETTEVSVENINSNEFSSTSPATSSERFPKNNQFSIGVSDDSLYAQTTEKELMAETTAMPKESGEQNTVPESDIQQSSENSHFFQSSSELPIDHTERHGENSTEKIYTENNEMKSSIISNSQGIENTMTTASFSNTDHMEDENSAEVGPTTTKPLNTWATGDQTASIGNESPFASSTDVEDTNTKQKITTMMPSMQSEEINQNSTEMNPVSMSIMNSSQSPEVSSQESRTEYPADEVTTQSAQNIINLASSQNTMNAEGEMMPTEPTINNFVTISDTKPNSSSMDSITSNIVTMTTSSSVESVTTTPDSSSSAGSIVIDPEFTNQNSSSSGETPNLSEYVKEVNQGTTEMPMGTDTLVTSELNETENHMNLKTENSQTTSEPAKISVEQSDRAHMIKESKIPSSDDSDSTVPTFLVGGENMPPIALTPNPDLSGPYSVDSTIQPIPEEEELEDIKPVDTFNSGDSTDTEGRHQWYDSKNALNSLDDDYNEEEKYASYKYTKGKPEHITKGYKSIKIEEKGRVPEDSDAVEQTHSHQTEQVPITTSESSNTVNLMNTEANESLTTIPPSEGSPSQIKEEEKLLIKEVYTEASISPNESNKKSEHLTEPQRPIQDFNVMGTDRSHEVSTDPNKSIDNNHMDTIDDSVVKEMNHTLKQNMSHLDVHKMNNYYAVTENVEEVDVNPTTLGNLQLPDGSTLEENVPRTTILYNSDSQSNNKTVCDPDHFACHDGSKCLTKLQQCDSIQDCPDGSDEAECEKLNCVENFKCNDGTCLSKHLVCNGIQNCPDGNDEENCDYEKKGEKKQYITKQPIDTEQKATESPFEKIELESTNPVEHLSSSNTEIPTNAMEAANSATESNVTKEDKSDAEIIQPVISITESPLSSVEPVMNEKVPESRSMDFAGGETATLSVPMETVMDGQVQVHTDSLPSPTEASMKKEEPMNPTEVVNEGTEPPPQFTNPNMKTNETPAPIIEPSSSEEPHLSSNMQFDTSHQETPASSMESVNSGTELPTMSMDSNMRSTDSPVISKEPEINNTEKPLSSMVEEGREVSISPMDSVNKGMDSPMNSVGTHVSNSEMTATHTGPVVNSTEAPSGDVDSDIVPTSIPVAVEVSQSSDEMAFINLTESTMRSTELPTNSSENIVSSLAEPSTVNTTVPPSNISTESQANGNTEITIFNTEPSPTIMESSTSHSEKSAKMTESPRPITDPMLSLNESDSKSTELPLNLMEQVPIQTALS